MKLFKSLLRRDLDGCFKQFCDKRVIVISWIVSELGEEGWWYCFKDIWASSWVAERLWNLIRNQRLHPALGCLIKRKISSQSNNHCYNQRTTPAGCRKEIKKSSKQKKHQLKSMWNKRVKTNSLHPPVWNEFLACAKLIFFALSFGLKI